MTLKSELLSAISQMAGQKLITKEEIISAFESGGSVSTQSDSAHLKLSDIMYYIGAAIVFLGICVLVFQNWDSFNAALRITITLGSFIACFLVGAILDRYENLKKVSQAFFLLSGLLAPVAANVTYKELGFDYTADSVQAGIFALLVVIFSTIFYFFRHTILLLFIILFGYGLFHFVVNMLIGQNFSSSSLEKVYEYRFMTGGLAFMLLGYYFSRGARKALTGFLYGIGCLAFLGSTMALGGWDPNQNVFWELIYPLLVFGILFLSVYVKSKAFLTFGSLFLIGYILKLTGEYFTTGLGWPLALVLAGLAIMAVGYYAVRLNKKYLSPTI